MNFTVNEMKTLMLYRDVDVVLMLSALYGNPSDGLSTAKISIFSIGNAT